MIRLTSCPFWAHRCAAACLGLLLLGVLALAARQAQTTHHQALQQLRMAQVEQRGQAAAPAPASPSPVALAHTSQAQELDRDLHRFAQAHAVQIQRIDTRQTTSSAQTLATVQLSLDAQGSYPGIKAWLAALLARYPALALDSLNLQALTPPAHTPPPHTPPVDNTLRAQVQLRLYLRD